MTLSFSIMQPRFSKSFRAVRRGLLLACVMTLAADSVLYAQEVSSDSSDERASSYILAPNDLVNVKVFQEDDLESKVRISRNGTVTLPLIGEVRIGGRTPQQAAQLIRDALAKGYLINPQVTLNVINFAKYRVTVLGQVQKPGSYDFPNRERLTLLEAVGLAGGYTRGADPSRVLVKRVVQGREVVYRLNGKKMASEGESTVFEILPGDVVTVSESRF